jgi:2-dehydropantoate 2-reductase
VQAPTHWHILGAGAMGCLFADALQRAGGSTTLLMRTGVTDKQLTVVVESGDTKREYRLAATNPDDTGAISHLLVTTKAYDVRAAVAGVAHRLLPGSVVLLLVNGMGLAEQLRADWPDLAIFCGTSTEGAYTRAAQHIVHAGRGETRIGRQGETASPPWFGLWQRGLGNCVWDPEINTALWQKLAVNCVINPLTAIHRCPNGALAEQPTLATQVQQLCDEVAAVSHAAGFSGVADSLPQTVAAVIAGTATNRSSMLQDIEQRRPTEIDYITGHLLQVAAQHGIDAPLNRALLEEISQRDP